MRYGFPGSLSAPQLKYNKIKPNFQIKYFFTVGAKSHLFRQAKAVSILKKSAGHPRAYKLDQIIRL